MPYCLELSDKADMCKEARDCLFNRLTESRSPGSGSTWPPPSSPSILVGLSNPLKSSVSKASSSSMKLSPASPPSLLCLKRLSPPAAILQVDAACGCYVHICYSDWHSAGEDIIEELDAEMFESHVFCSLLAYHCLFAGQSPLPLMHANKLP